MYYSHSKQARQTRCRCLKALAITAAVSLLAGCSSEGSVIELEQGPTVVIGLPQVLFNTGFLVDANLEPVVTLSNGDTVSMNPDGDTWAGTINLEAGDQYTVTVVWFEEFQGEQLPLAQRSGTITLSDDGSIEQSFPGNYDVNFDTDDDGESNFKEREDGTDPLVNENNPTNGNMTDIVPTTADVIVPRISEADAPDIDGAGVQLDSDSRFIGEWSQAVQTDISGSLLAIDNLMIDVNAEPAGATPYRRWAAMHDGTYVYVVVVVDDDGQRRRDSGSAYQDDSLELFLDGDNSKSQRYGSDDFHLTFPLRDAGDESSRAGLVNEHILGPFSSTANLDILSATGPGMGPEGIRRPRFEQDVYELRIELESATISTDAPFGFELQVNDDDDGAERDSKWGWKHPARVDSDVDNTFTNPSFMGTLMLE